MCIVQNRGWKRTCNGHEPPVTGAVATSGETSAAPPLPPPAEFPDEPLKNRRLVESFSGDPSKGGCHLSDAWERAGGAAERRDILISTAHDMLHSETFWKDELKKPADVYSFAPPCTTLSAAHTTPVLRSSENPYGDETNPEVNYANRLVYMTLKRALQVLSVGAHVLIENPLMSYFWLFDEVKKLLGCLGMCLVRIDQCTVGTPL